MFRRAISKSDSGEIGYNPIFRGYALFIFGFAGSRLLFIWSDFERLTNDVSVLYTQIVFLSYLVGVFSSLSLINIFEGNILRSEKRILTKIFTGCAFIILFVFLILIFLPDLSQMVLNPFRYVVLGLSTLGFFVIFTLFWKIIKNSAGDLKRKAEITFIAVFVLFFGTVIDSDLIIQQLNIPIWLPAIFPIIGIILFTINQKTI
jgi:hypothetical protein